MKHQKFSRLFGNAASVAALFLFSSALMVSGAHAQSTDAAPAISLPSGTSAVPFLVAPSFVLAGAPSSVAMGDLNQDGKPDLVTTDAVSGKITVFLGTGNGKFATGVEYASGSHPSAVAVADLNGDGHMEILVGDESKGMVSVYTSNGNGTLQLKQGLAAGINPAYFAVGDFNGDGKTDLIVASRSTVSVSILLNDGKGNLQKPTLSPLHKATSSITTADLNNDGHADLALANADGTVSILLGAGDGTFHALSDISVASGALSSIVVGDFDHDGNVDVAVTQSGGKALTVLLGKGNGGFAAPAHYGVGNNPVSSLVSDLDGDGVADLVVVNQGSNTYSVLAGNGDGTFKSSLDYVVGNGPVAAVAGAFDAEGHVDLAVINPSSQTVTVPLGNGDGTFKAARSYLAGIGPRAVASADLNGDKLADLVVTNYCGSDLTCSKSGSVAIFLANANGTYRLSNSYALGAGPVSVALADVNGDKIPDIVALNRGDKTVSVLVAKGDGSFEQPYTFAVTDSPVAVAVGDFNKDGKADLAILGDCGAAKCSQFGSVEVFTGRGDGNFSSAFSYPTGYSPVSIAVGDLNQDKNLDIVVANSCGADATCKSAGTATVLLGGASGKFTAGASVSVGKSPSSIALGDMGGRGVPDLLVSNASGNTLTVLHGNGDGSFKTPTAYTVGNSPGSLVIGDFDGDGRQDVAVANVLDSTVSVLFGKGDGTLSSSVTMPVGPGPAALAAIAGANGAHASLVTANGNTGAATPGTDFTVLTNIQPDVLGAGTTDVVIAYGTTAPNPSLVDQSVDLTVTVTPNPVSANVPGGTVTFLSGVVAIPDCGTAGAVVPVAGVAKCTTSSLLAGSDSLTATYSGDTNFAANSVSNALAQVVNKATPTVTVAFQTGSSSPSIYGDAVTVVATIGAAGPVVPAGGTVTFADGVTTFPCENTVTLTAGATSSSATCTVSTLAGGAHNINATYVPQTDLNFKTGTSTTALPLTVNQVAPTVTVGFASGSSSPTPFGTSVSFTATIAGLTGAGLVAPAGGTVTFTDTTTSGTTPLTCTNTVTVAPSSGNNSAATCTVASITTGAHTINATYTSTTATDPNYSTATSAAGLALTVSTKATTTTITSPGTGTSNVDDSVTFVATVTSTPATLPAPSGTVSFTLNGDPITSCTAVSKSGGVWTCVTQLLVAPADFIGANYNGDLNYATSTATKFPQSVNKIAANTTATTSLSPSVVNQLVTFTASVKPSGVANPAILPSGNVVFKQGSTTLCSAGLTPGSGASTASCGFPFAAVLASPGAAITATYAGDSNFTAGTQGSVNQVVKPANTTAVITTASPGTSNVNQSVVFGSTVTPSPFGSPNGSVVPASGSMAIFDTSSTTPTTPICTATVTNGIVQTCSFAFASSGTHNLDAVFTSTDANFNTSATSAVFAYVVNSSGTSIAPSANPTASTVDQPVVLSAVLNFPSGGSATPTGTVIFTDTFTSPSTLLCTVTLTATGTVPTCPAVALLIPGTHTIVASYKPDAGSSFNPTSGTLSIVVTKGTPTIGLTLAPSPSSVDQNVTFTSSITNSFAAPGTSVPTGTVTFSYAPNGTSTTLCTANVNGAGTSASCSSSFPAATVATPYTVTATYSGDGNFTAGTPAQKSQTVTQTGTSVSITPIAPGFSVNQAVTFTATVGSSVPDAGLTLPTGTVTFSDTTSVPNVVLCKATVTASTGVASCGGAFGTIGARTVTAVYSGDGNFVTSTSATTSPAVAATATTVSIASSTPNPSTVNQAVMLTATLTPAFTGATVPQAGTVAFSDAFTSPATTICTANVANGAVAACAPYKFVAFGTHNITATFTTADTNFKSSPVSALIKQVVNAAGTSVVMTPFTASVGVNSVVSFNSTVTSTTAGSAVPQGTVAYLDGAKGPTLCTATLSGTGSATCSAPVPTAGTHTIEAAFTPSASDSNFTAATSLLVNLTINQNNPVVAITPPASAFTTDQPVTYSVTIAQSPAGSTNTGVTPNVPPTYPTGTVSFSFVQSGGQPTVVACAGQSANGATITPGNATAPSSASCTFPFPAAGSYTVSAAYNGDGNFNNVTQTVGSQTVGTTVPTVNITSPASAAPFVVNQQVTFSASVTKPAADTGPTLPSGSVTFSDTTASPAVALCTATLVVSGSNVSASCPAAFITAGTRTVTAVYNPLSGNTNFGNAAPATVKPVISANSTTTQVTSSSPLAGNPALPTSVATQSVIFTALVQQAAPAGGLLTGSAEPTGNIVFQSSDGATNTCGPNHNGVIPVTAAPNGSATATCAFSFNPGSSGAYTVTATYTTGDGNFASSVGTTAQAVQNFAVAFAPSTPITLTQGYSNDGGKIDGVATVKDLFTPASVTAISIPGSGYADPLTVTCVVKNSSGTIVTDPSCAANPSTLVGSGVTPVPFTVSASHTAPVDQYSVTLTATDTIFKGLVQSSAPLLVNVINTSGTLSLSVGAAATQSLKFDTATTPSGTTFAPGSYACGTVVPLGDLPVPASGSFSCTGPSSPVPVTNPFTTISITITINGSTASASLARPPSLISTAAFWAVPLLALLAWFGRRNSPRRNFFRFLGMLLLIGGLSHAIGCGGSFTPPAIATGGPTPGSYLVQVIATDSAGTPHSAVVPVTVVSNKN